MIYFYYAGTSTPISVYHDAGVTPMTNPVVLDASGHTKMCGDMDRAYSVNVMDMYGQLTWQTGFAGPSYYFAGLLVHDTLYLALKTDTLIKRDTIIKKDTVRLVKIDTIKKTDTVYQSVKYVHDTLTLINLQIVIDTFKLIQHDTVFRAITDTLRKIDTFNIIQHDTVNTCKDGTFAKYSEKLFTSIGSSTNDKPEGRVFMDRIYSVKEEFASIIANYGRMNNMLMKVDGDHTKYKMELTVDNPIPVNANNDERGPYLDSFKPNDKTYKTLKIGG
jgi:hypothetical protein